MTFFFQNKNKSDSPPLYRFPFDRKAFDQKAFDRETVDRKFSNQVNFELSSPTKNFNLPFNPLLVLRCLSFDFSNTLQTPSFTSFTYLNEFSNIKNFAKFFFNSQRAPRNLEFMMENPKIWILLVCSMKFDRLPSFSAWFLTLYLTKK